MADDPIDLLISATLTLEGEEARAERATLPFTGNASSAHVPESAPVDSFHVDSGTVSEANPWPPEEAARHPPAPPPALSAAPEPVTQVFAAQRVPSQPQPPAPVASSVAAYAASVGMPSAMPAMIARVVAGTPAQPIAPPPRISDAALAHGATASAFAASNAATEARGASPLGERELARAPVAAPRAALERIDFLWHDKLAEPDILRAPSMKKDVQDSELEDEWLTPHDAAAASSKEAAAIRAILAQRAPRSFDEIPGLYEASLDAGTGRLHCLVRGELALSFEPIEALRATLSVITPFLPADARLKDAYEAAQAALKTSAGIAPAIASSHKERLDEALRTALRGSSSALESVVDRALIEGRSFSRRKVFGGSFVRGMLHPSRAPSHGSPAIPCYVSEAAAEELPLMRSLPVRLIVEVRPSQDAVETHALAFRVVALAREVDLAAKRR